MKKDDALSILDNAPRSSKPWSGNPVLTQNEIWEIVVGAVNENKTDTLPSWLARRVNDVAKG